MSRLAFSLMTFQELSKNRYDLPALINSPSSKIISTTSEAYFSFLYQK